VGGGSVGGGSGRGGPGRLTFCVHNYYYGANGLSNCVTVLIVLGH
jgi:hypothetical protein